MANVIGTVKCQESIDWETALERLLRSVINNSMQIINTEEWM